MLDVNLFDGHYHDTEYSIEEVIDYIERENLSFGYIGKCDSECESCNKNEWNIIREDVLYIDGKGFISIEKATDEEIENNYEIDFCVYECDKCKHWITYIIG